MLTAPHWAGAMEGSRPSVFWNHMSASSTLASSFTFPSGVIEAVFVWKKKEKENESQIVSYGVRSQVSGVRSQYETFHFPVHIFRYTLGVRILYYSDSFATY